MDIIFFSSIFPDLAIVFIYNSDPSLTLAIKSAILSWSSLIRSISLSLSSIPDRSLTFEIRLLNLSSWNFSMTLDVSKSPNTIDSRSKSIGTSLMIVARSLLILADSIFSSTFFFWAPFNLSTLERTPSTLPYSSNSLIPVFSPIPGMPGMLSDLSPIRPLRSINWSGLS